MSYAAQLHHRLFDQASLSKRSRGQVSGAGRLLLPVLRRVAPDDTGEGQSKLQQEKKTKVL
jgi:hypothetical protein